MHGTAFAAGPPLIHTSLLGVFALDFRCLLYNVTCRFFNSSCDLFDLKNMSAVLSRSRMDRPGICHTGRSFPTVLVSPRMPCACGQASVGLN